MFAVALHHAKQLFVPGDEAVTEVDLRAIDLQTQRTHIPHEVKAPWAEEHGGRHFVELLQDKRKRKCIARPAAQLLYYMVTDICTSMRVTPLP